MNKKFKNINLINIETELKKSYLNYAMSVIIGRALPDIRDGLKPVHRRIIYAMYILDNKYNKAYKKSARIVGDVIGKYHPHGDNAVYESIVRMAQKFSLRYPLIDGQGNFGSIDGDSAAAMRYTEIRMSKITQEFLKDIKKNTINYINNYDNSEKIPEILPTKIPNILINGSTGIAVGMATNIPPHNIIEVMNAFLAFIDNKKLNTKSLMKYIKGPDFPTGGIIEKNEEIYKAYKTGRGTIQIKAKIKIEIDKKTKKKNIIIYELPYQINKSKLIEKIIELIKDKKIEGINNIKDESDKDGMRINIETKKDANNEIIINKLFYLTNLQISYGINMVALHNGQPKILKLKDIIYIFIKHRKKIIKNKIIFKLNYANKKLHILEGLLISLNNIDYIINLIKTSKDKKEIKKKLENLKWNINEKKIFKKKYKLSKKQIKSILKINLIKLTQTEQHKILYKYNNIKKQISNLNFILKNSKEIKKIIKKEFTNIKNKFGDKRITKINKKFKNIKNKDLIKKENVVITLSKLGYIKYQKLSTYETQHKGGKGKLAVKIKKEDFMNQIIVTNTHRNIFLFSNKGKLFITKVYKLPYYGRTSKGKPIINILSLGKDEKITNILPVNKNKLSHYIFMTTSNGIIKKIKIKEINIKKRKKGLNIIKLKNNDELIKVNITNGKNKIMLFTKKGKAIKFSEKNIRTMGRNAYGIKGIKLSKKDNVVSGIILNDVNKEILIVTENGYGKRTYIKEFKTRSRATIGIKSIKINKKNGNVIDAQIINKNDQIMLITNKGKLIRISVSEINILKRNTQGIILIRTKEKDEKLIGIQRISIVNKIIKT